MSTATTATESGIQAGRPGTLTAGEASWRRMTESWVGVRNSLELIGLDACSSR